MATKILLVSNNTEESGLLEEELTKVFEEDPESPSVVSVQVSTSEQSARKALPGDFNLVITPLRIRKTPTSAVEENEKLGLQLLRWMGTNQMRMPSILIAPTYPDELLDGGPGLERIHFVKSGGDMIQEVAKRSRKLVHQAPLKCLNVEVLVRDRTHWEFKLSGQGFPYESEHTLILDEAKMSELVESSNDLSVPGTSDWWKDKLLKTRKKLGDALWPHQEFMKQLLQAVNEAGGETHSRVRFAVTPDVHELALEVLPSPQLSDVYWMLRAPVYRRLLSEPPSAAGTLFEGGERIECLIIEAPVKGWVQNPDIYLDNLTHISDECATLHGWLKQNQEKFNLGEPVYVRPEPGKGNMAKRVQELLESREWGIVHYAGHSHFDAKKNLGYVFFPGETPEAVDSVEITKFSGWLRKAKFVYLSSCKSGAGHFMFELASRRVSNLMGFRWPIDDEMASTYARIFYENLFEKRSFEKAFLKGKQAMHEDYPDDRIWASPLLIMQLSES
ncbi:MAG: CHAT domain-containing protein [Bryobacteraceae bacterium]